MATRMGAGWKVELKAGNLALFQTLRLNQNDVEQKAVITGPTLA
ncbi:MAG: hypothetical protein ACLPKB_22310 [Xanthobacteraceae bacterium]